MDDMAGSWQTGKRKVVIGTHCELEGTSEPARIRKKKHFSGTEKKRDTVQGGG